ncbi:hypothetical protein O181_047684 [Austropuccinia psidii MF-1]|uniref:Uncharacterized protein n=1 Tax=Austropuccinia psidii MF-1 TaxID=1389203 RepID=A0A9Q3HMA5_9BASI|nr:hypothetical protein [Austropuccinia psidii MF-1]
MPWQKKPKPIPKPILPHFIKLIREMIRTGLYEHYTSTHTRPVFCVANSNGKLRIVDDLQELKKLKSKDEGLPPHIKQFLDVFSRRDCYVLGYLMGVYDERELDIYTIPLITFEAPLERLQLTGLPQGETNSVAVYQAQMTWILQE